MSNLTISKKYDSSADVLYISIGEPRPAISKSVKECDSILIRYDMVTKDICGVTIIDFSHFNKDYLLQHIPIQGLSL